MAYTPPPPSGEVEIDPLRLNDLSDLPPTASLTADDILPILRTRFLEGLVYTDLSPRVLVALNPYQFIQTNSQAVLADWSAEYSDSGNAGVRGRLGPHVWALSGRAYYYMRRTGQDQTIVLR